MIFYIQRFNFINFIKFINKSKCSRLFLEKDVVYHGLSAFVRKIYIS